jgi:hypothetical protein
MNGLQDAAVVPNGLDIGLGPGLFDEQSAESLADRSTLTASDTLLRDRLGGAGKTAAAAAAVSGEADFSSSFSGQLRHRHTMGL